MWSSKAHSKCLTIRSTTTWRTRRTSLRIGKEDSGVDKCAIITAAYKVGDEVVGRAGVIGPERMDYKKVIGVLEYMKKALGTVLDNDDKDEE